MMTGAELGQRMRRGIQYSSVQERQDSFLRRLDGGMVGVCGLGAALIDLKGGDVHAALADYEAPGPWSRMGPRRLAILLGIPENLAFEISRSHHVDGRSIEEMSAELIETGTLRSLPVIPPTQSPFFAGSTEPATA